MSNASMRRRYLVLWLPWLACERIRRAVSYTSSAPLVLVTRSGNALRLTAVDVRASRLGLRKGMTLADARARCPDLESLPHDPDADARELEALAARMLRFTPMVSPDPPDGLMLDITACAHLFGGEAELVQLVMAEAGYTARHAVADHGAAARALARYGTGSGDVRDLPVAALELPDEALSGLRRAGLATLGELAVRPRAALAARFGEEAMARLLAILGERDSPMAPLRPAIPLRAQARFAEPIARTEYVLEVIEDLLLEVFRQMEERQLGGRRFVVWLERADGARRRLTVDTSMPCRDAPRVLRLFNERIEGLADPLDPGFGFDAMTLAVPRTEPLPPAQTAIASEARAETESIAALIDRLSTRFGPEHVLRLSPCDTHVPEAAQRLVPAVHTSAAPWPNPALKPPRPLLLLDPPQPVTAVASVPDGPPQRLRWRGRVHEVVLAEGPERIAAEWWRKPEGHLPESAGLTRDYYRIEDETGCRYWVFRHGLFGETAGKGKPGPRWYIHGLFA